MADINWGKQNVKMLMEEGKLAQGLQAICSYAKQLDLYQRYFNRDDILVIHFEDLIHASEITLEKIYDFLDLGLEYRWRPSLGHVHSSQERIIDFFKNHEDHVYPGMTPSRMLAWQLSEEHKAQIRDWVKDDICILKDKYNIDTSHWGY